ncbi:MAG: glycoside-pentoside-hexuronide (GPH):cation symporter [Pseudomonadota bacterium]
MTVAENAMGVPWRIRLAYGAPAFALAVVGIPIYVFIPKFYTDVVGVPVAAVGAVLLAVRLFDAVTDPLVGMASDRTRSPFGRRRPYIAAGGVLVALAVAFLFMPPVHPGANATLWFGTWMFLLFFFWTTVTVPYESLGPEITFDYRQRTAVFAVRDGLLIAGTVAAAAAPRIVSTLLDAAGMDSGQRSVFAGMAVLYAPLLILTCIGCTLIVREPPPPRKAPHAPAGIDLRSVLSNRPFIVLLAAYTVSAVGSNLPATLILFYVEHVLQSQRADLFLMLYFVTGIIALPAWTLAAGRFDRKRVWLVSMALNTGAFSGVFFLGAGDEFLYGLLVSLSGLGFGASLALPSAIQADVIDYDEWQTGRRREGLYVGIWSVAKKAAAAAGLGGGLWALGVAGYEPNANQSDTVLMTLRVAYALVPSICSFLAILIALAYKLDRNTHEEIRRLIAARNMAAASG